MIRCGKRQILRGINGLHWPETRKRYHSREYRTKAKRPTDGVSRSAPSRVFQKKGKTLLRSLPQAFSRHLPTQLTDRCGHTSGA